MTGTGGGAAAERVRADYDERAAGLQAVLDAVRREAWDAPSACEGWTGRDVVVHLVDSQRDFFAARGVDLGERPDLADPAAAWRTHASAVRAALAEPGVVEREYEGFGGGRTTVGESVDQFLGFDMVAHRWDVAVADGRAHVFTDADLTVIEQLVAAMSPHLYTNGVSAPPLDVGPGADRQTRALASIGRRATVGG